MLNLCVMGEMDVSEQRISTGRFSFYLFFLCRKRSEVMVRYRAGGEAAASCSKTLNQGH